MAFLDEVRRTVDDRSAQSQHGHAVKCVKRVCAYFEIDIQGVKEDAEFSLNWFHQNFPTFPVRMEARKLSINVEKFFSAMTKTEAFMVLMDLIVENEDRPVALLVPAYGQGLFVLHNCWLLESVPGFTRLIRVANSKDKGVIFEPIEAFLESVKRSGWRP